MVETNGRWKIAPITAITVAINLIGWGITLGTILTRLDAHENRLARLEDAIFPTLHASERTK